MQIQTLGFLGTDVDQTDPRGIDAQNLIHIHTAHHTELGEHIAAALGVCARVDQHKAALLVWDDGRDGGAAHSLEAFDHQRRAHDHRTGAACGNKGIALSVLERAHSDCHRAVFIVLEQGGRVRLDRYHPFGIQNLHSGQVDAVLLRAAFNLLAVAAEQNLHAVFVGCLSCAFDHLQRSVVPSKGIYNNLHGHDPLVCVIIAAVQDMPAENPVLGWQSAHSVWFYP